MNEAEAIRQLNQQLKTKPRKRFNDGSHVVKVRDVVSIVEEVLGTGNAILKTGIKVATALVSGTPGDPVNLDSAQQIVDKVRDKVLKQTAKRKRITYRYSKREI
jgi:hypothetical protein